MPLTIAAPSRSETFRARMTPDEVAMVAALARNAGVSGSDIVRLLIREAYRLRYGEAKPAPKGGSR